MLSGSFRGCAQRPPETARAGRFGVEDGVVQPALGQRRALLGEYMDGIFDLDNAFGLIRASGLLDGFDAEAHRFQRVEQEGIADGLACRS